MAYRLKRQKHGVFAVHDTAFGETMHPGHGPWLEANRLYVEGGALPALLEEAGARGSEAVVFDVGLGAAANALAAVTCHQERLGRGRPVRPLRLVSFESDPAGAEFARDEADALGYPRGHEPVLDALLADGRVELPGGLTWELRLGDFPALISAEPRRADLIFFDPFSPASNPAMWALPVLEGLYRCRRPGGATRLVTYSSAMGTRAGLLLAGFHVGEGPRLDPRGATTVAAVYRADLAHPLAPAWLARWRRAADPWPRLTPPGRHRELRTRLLEHPQWETGAPDLPDDPPAADTLDRPRKPRHRKWRSEGSKKKENCPRGGRSSRAPPCR